MACERDQCTKCLQPDFLLKGRCIASCPTGFYNNYDDQTCIGCHPSCSSCFTSGEEGCRACPRAKCLEAGQCKDTCTTNLNLGFYEAAEASARCGSRCSVCNHKCWQCEYGYTLNGGSCIGSASCAAGQFFDLQCQPCPENCLTCSKERCLSCMPGLTHFREQCVSRFCTKGYYASTKQCVFCMHSQYWDFAATVCRNCSTSCVSCKDGNSCYECADGYMAVNGKCVNSCPSGLFLNKGRCLMCHPSCASCLGPALQDCTGCPPGSYSTQGVCEPCPDNCAQCDDSVCFSCLPGYESAGSDCVKEEEDYPCQLSLHS
jgi:proprotein convertase subtilisin/kexin type 5